VHVGQNSKWPSFIISSRFVLKLQHFYVLRSKKEGLILDSSFGTHLCNFLFCKKQSFLKSILRSSKGVINNFVAFFVREALSDWCAGRVDSLIGKVSNFITTLSILPLEGWESYRKYLFAHPVPLCRVIA